MDRLFSHFRILIILALVLSTLDMTRVRAQRLPQPGERRTTAAESTATFDKVVFLPFVVNISGGSSTPAFTIDQTLSDGAQRDTIAFDGLAFITGNLGADSFFPPGKVADFWGFQYLRDNDPSQHGPQHRLPDPRRAQYALHP